MITAALATLSELVRFAAANGEDIAVIVSQFIAGRPDILEPPPPPAADETDRELDEMIEDGREL
jgi:hypothetical protein